MYRTAINDKFSIHTMADLVGNGWVTGRPTKITKRFIIQERDVSYRLTLHQHPYVQRLTSCLLAGGVPGLQATDTEYVGNEARPNSLLFEIGPTDVRAAAGARLALRADTVVNGGALQLAAGMTFTLANASIVTPFADPPAPGQPTTEPRLRAVLLGDLATTPRPGETLPLPAGRQALVQGNTLVRLRNLTPIVLSGGTIVSLPPLTPLALADGASITLPAAMDVTIVRSKRRPFLYDDLLPDYQPTSLVQRPYPVLELDFSYGGAYSVYNWELFYHVPLTIAIHLSKNGRYAEAQRWFHFLFDPTDNSDGPTPDRFWKVQPFHTTDVHKIEEILVNLVTGADPALREETIHSINLWKATPFRPHVIARYRQGAYMIKTVTAYLDNLIAWGDSLFRQDTGEAIDEALTIYVLAANILGRRMQVVPAKGSIRPQTYHNLRRDLRHFGSVVRDLETAVPFDLAPLPPAGGEDTGGLATVRSLGQALYFCVPRNDKLLGYWDTVADRLFKIHNSLNIKGIFRQLALFEPSIDPAMLARAAAAGLDVAAIVSGLNQPLPLVRFQLLAQKAAEIAQEVKSLGNNLLSAIEKEDGEAIAILRARHERAILEMVEHVKYTQLQEATKAYEGLLNSLALAIQRFTFYELQLGRTLDEIQKALPGLDDLDYDALSKLKFKMEEPALVLREIQVDIATDVFAAAAGALYGGKLLSSHETRESLFLEGGQLASDIANILSLASGIAHAVPTFKGHVQPWGFGATVEYGGKDVGAALGAGSTGARAVAERLNFEARRAARIDGFARRERDWAHQSNLAAGEINQTLKQLRAAQLRQAVAEQELTNHRTQIANAQEVEFFLTGERDANWTQRITPKEKKVANRPFYAWMKREVKGLYGQAFQFAFDIAKKAERALQHELGDPSLTYLQFGYLAGKEGLLAGEKLYLDVKRMEMAYLELNRREYELTKHASLLQVNPLALIELRATGRCTVRLPEELFDMDGPGHYFRRIKSVAVSIPCVTGPYASVNCTLTLLKSSIRATPVVGDDYARADAEDPRFSDNFSSLQSIVTSSGQNDSGLFETNLRDERYLPFENSGVISEWQLQLPANPSQGDPRQFDYDTISDVILHLRYTAREGGGLLRQGAVARGKALMEEAQAVGAVRLFSARHEFPSEWARFLAEPAAGQRRELLFNLRPEHYPFWSKGRLDAVDRIDVLARSTVEPVPPTLVAFDQPNDDGGAARELALEKETALGGLLRGAIIADPPPGPPSPIPLPAKPDTPLRLCFETGALADVWLAVRWKSEAS